MNHYGVLSGTIAVMKWIALTAALMSVSTRLCLRAGSLRLLHASPTKSSQCPKVAR